MELFEDGLNKEVNLDLLGVLKAGQETDKLQSRNQHLLLIRNNMMRRIILCSPANPPEESLRERTSEVCFGFRPPVGLSLPPWFRPSVQERFNETMDDEKQHFG